MQIELSSTATPRPERRALRPAPALPGRAIVHAAVRVSSPRPARRAVLLYGESYHHPNLLHRSAFLAPDPVVLIDEGRRGTTLWVNGMELGRARKEAKVTHVRSFDELNLRDRFRAAGPGADRTSVLLAAILEAHGLRECDVDTDFPALQLDGMRALGLDVTPKPGLYERSRRIKTQSEILKIKAVQDAGQDALQRAIDVIRAAEIRDGILYRDGKPLTGADLVRVVETRLLELGCSTEDSICCGGPDNADPHRATSDVLRAGLPIVLDIFPFSKSTRFWGDMTRTVVRGTPPPEVQRMWDAVKEAQETALAMVRPGVSARDIHRTVCDVLKRHGYGSSAPGYDDIKSDARFIHGTGHGVGLEIHEDPSIGGTDIPLEVGDVITIEPGLYDPRLGGIRIEDLVVVTRDGYRQLTPLPKVFRLD